MRGLEIFTCILEEQQVTLTAPLATASDGGPGERPVVQPEPPAVPPSGTNEGNWTCWNAKNAKGMPSTMCFLFN